MRLVQVTIPAGKREQLLSVLDEEEIDYVVTDETSSRNYTAIVYFPLPANAVESVLDQIRTIGLGDEDYTVVLDAETVVSRRFTALEKKYAEENGGGERISRQEIYAKAEEMMPERAIYVTMTVISTVVATAGLFLDSAAVVVGSMIIAPLLGPAIGASVGTITADRELFSRGLKLQISGVLLAIASATVFALFVKTAKLVPTVDPLSIEQIQERLTPSFLELAVALGAGVAGALSLSTGVSTAIVGALIAAALIPPIAVVGVGIAWWEPYLVLGPSVLVLVNLISINLAALAVLWYSGYRPQALHRQRSAASRTNKRTAMLVVAILILSGFLGGATYTSYQQATFEEQTSAEVADLVEARSNGDLRVLDVEVAYDNQIPFNQPEQVTVTLGRYSNEEYPGLAADLDARIHTYTDADVAVQIRFVDLQDTDSVR